VPFRVALEVVKSLSNELRLVHELAHRSAGIELHSAEYLARVGPQARPSLRWLLSGGREWKAVTFPAFYQASMATFDAALLAMARCVEGSQGELLCLCIDSPRKSSFWMAAMFLSHIAASMRSSNKAAQVVARRLYVVVGGQLDDDLDTTLASMPASTTRVFIDDAAYSGKQLCEYIGYINDRFAAASHVLDDDTARTRANVVIVPFVSTTAEQALRHLHGDVQTNSRKMPRLELISSASFPGIFQARPLQASMLHDVILMEKKVRRDSREGQNKNPVMSLFFDFLHLESFHTCTVFEHKIPDAISIPHMWLHMGPLPLSTRFAFFKLNKNHYDELARNAQAIMLKDEPGPKDLSRALCQVLGMCAPAARRRYLVTLDQKPTQRGAVNGLSEQSEGYTLTFTSPILAPASCDVNYQRELSAYQAVLTAAVKNPISSMQRAHNYLPECFEAPYKHPDLQRGIQRALEGF